MSMMGGSGCTAKNTTGNDTVAMHSPSKELRKQ